MFRSLVFACFLVPLAASGLDGHFYLSKSTYSAGEPVYLIFEVRNTETQPVMIRTADALSFCGGYKIEVEGAKNQESFGCYSGVGGSCASSVKVLRSGESLTDRILLNRTYDLRKPGRYLLHVTHKLPFGPGDGDLTMLMQDGSQETFEEQLDIVIEPSDESELKPRFEGYLKDLQSRDEQKRIDAAQVIANLAPPFLEGTILEMLDSPQLRYFAVRGLRNLGTPGAHQALANFVKNSPPTQITGEYQDAIRCLGEIGDRSDLAMLLDVAHANPPGSYRRDVAMMSAAKVGGDDAIPLLAAEFKNPSLDVQQSAVRALYLTGSRAAVPVLIELLRSPQERISRTAEFGLETLTHHGAPEPDSGVQSPTNYAKWIQWWNTHRQTATIFRYDECGEIELIK